jgi:hypothetical protein
MVFPSWFPRNFLQSDLEGSTIQISQLPDGSDFQFMIRLTDPKCLTTDEMLARGGHSSQFHHNK